mgnify:CR=1 FL=1
MSTATSFIKIAALKGLPTVLQAVAAGDMEEVGSYLASSKKKNLAKTDDHGRNGLHYAVMLKSEEMCDVVLQGMTEENVGHLEIEVNKKVYQINKVKEAIDINDVDEDDRSALTYVRTTFEIETITHII